MTSIKFCDAICDFVWQYEHRKKWFNFSDEEILLLNESIKKGQLSVSLSSKKRKKPVTVNFDRMVQIHDVSLYEQRIRCLIGDSEFNVWLYKSEKNEWISFGPYLVFLFEIAYNKKESIVSLPNFEVNVERFEQIDKVSKDIFPIQRECVVIAITEEIQKIIEKNKEIFKSTCSKEFNNLKRSFDAISTISMNGTATKKRRKDAPSADAEELVPPSNTLEIKDNLGIMKMSKKGSTLSVVPVDKECPIESDHHVYVENTSFSATLNQTNLQNNNNKFYIIQLLEHNENDFYAVWRRWGRVGQRGQINLNKYRDLTEAKSEFEKKFFDKTKNNWSEAKKFVHVKGKYDLLQINLNPQAKPVESTDVLSKLIKEVKALMDLICDTKRMEEIMKEMSYDCNKTPLGELTLQQVRSGYIALSRIATVLKKGGSHSELLNACNDFYTKIPHNFGMKTPPIIKTQKDLDDKQKMLEALSNIQVAMKMMNTKSSFIEHPVDKYYSSLECSLDPLEVKSPEFQAINKCLQETHGPTHNGYKLEIIDAFKCHKYQEDNTFTNSENKLLLWHGSRTINWLGILKEGLRIAPPEAPVTGYMFGKGIYFADVCSKSANYCFATKRKNEGILLICEVALGKQFPLLQADEEMPRNLPSDYNSVVGKGRVSPSDFIISALSSEAKLPAGPLVTNHNHAGALYYNEYIVYNVNHVKMRYLLRVKFNFI